MLLVFCVTWLVKRDNELDVEMEMVFLHIHILITQDSQSIRRIDMKGVKYVAMFEMRSRQTFSQFIDLVAKSNWSNIELHDKETCLCNRGKIGKEQKAVANEKRRAYYKTEAGIETKRKYREKVDVKRKILNQLAMLNVSKKAEL